MIHWDTFNATHFFLPDDFHNTKPLIGVDLHDIMVRTGVQVVGVLGAVWIGDQDLFTLLIKQCI